MRRKFLFVVLLVLLFATAFHIGQATAWTAEPTLSAVATKFAERPAGVRCYGPDEAGSPAKVNAWGYVRDPVWKAKYEAIDGTLCDAALHINDPAIDSYHRALAVLVIVHESYHLRHWGAAGSEAKVECAAIRHWKYGARFLGATDATLEVLWPMALALHQEETGIVDMRTGERPYYLADCGVPPILSDTP